MTVHFIETSEVETGTPGLGFTPEAGLPACFHALLEGKRNYYFSQMAKPPMGPVCHWAASRTLEGVQWTGLLPCAVFCLSQARKGLRRVSDRFLLCVLTTQEGSGRLARKIQTHV